MKEAKMGPVKSGEIERIRELPTGRLFTDIGSDKVSVRFSFEEAVSAFKKLPEEMRHAETQAILIERVERRRSKNQLHLYSE